MNAVIFDVDGVLVDSYAAHLESWLILARERGIALTERDFAATFGRTSRDILVSLFNVPADDREALRTLDDRKEALYREIVAGSFPAMPGARELIRSLAAHDWRIAAGSSGPPENAMLCLEALNVYGAFNAVITGRDVTRGKPDPQVFQLAAERLSAPPARCVVIEDAPAGIEAARRAGMRCVGFASTGRTPDELRDADCVIDALEALTPARLLSLLDEAH